MKARESLRFLYFPLWVVFFVSAGRAVAQQTEALISSEVVWSIRKGQTPPPSAWNEADFELAADWFSGPAPIGYGENGIQTQLSDMRQQGGRPGYASVFLRAEFSLADPYPIETLILNVKYDDGFVAYLNGEPIASQNMRTANNPPYNELAQRAIEPTSATIDVSEQKSLLLVGKNVLAVQVHNGALDSSDLWWEATLEAGFAANPFTCISQVSCEDLGDAYVRFSWSPAPQPPQQVVIREVGQEDPVLAVSGSQNTGEIRVEPGDHLYRFFAVQGGQECYGGICAVTVSPVQVFVRGDVNDDGVLNIVDPVFLARFLFQHTQEPSCHDAGDSDDSGDLDLGDVIYLLRYLFDLGPLPADPGPEACGPDLNRDELPKCEYQHCAQTPG